MVSEFTSLSKCSLLAMAWSNWDIAQKPTSESSVPSVAINSKTATTKTYSVRAGGQRISHRGLRGHRGVEPVVSEFTSLSKCSLLATASSNWDIAQKPTSESSVPSVAKNSNGQIRQAAFFWIAKKDIRL